MSIFFKIFFRKEVTQIDTFYYKNINFIIKNKFLNWRHFILANFEDVKNYI